MRLHLVPYNTRIDFIKMRTMTFIVALVISLSCLFGIFFKGINYGIDFQGGYIFDVAMPQKVDVPNLREQLHKLEFGEVVLQSFGSDRELLIKIERKDGDDQEHIIQSVKNVLGEGVDYRKLETVGPKVGGELVQNGIKAVGFALIAMLAYIALRFEWQFALCAVLALCHDCLAILGLFSLFPFEFNETAIIAILITAGYSVNDTIVIFDRIRENMRKFKNTEMKKIINMSLNETLSRTVLTATTTLLALLALYFFGGKVISVFSLPIIFGIIIGSFSSICLAAPLLLHLNLKNRDASSVKPSDTQTSPYKHS